MVDPVYLKSPQVPASAGPDLATRDRVSEMLLRIERDGVDAVRA
jgi:hypothetical protein